MIPLHDACFVDKNFEIIKGANVNIVNNDGDSPLIIACRKERNFKVIKLLIREGAKIIKPLYLTLKNNDNVINFLKEVLNSKINRIKSARKLKKSFFYI